MKTTVVFTLIVYIFSFVCCRESKESCGDVSTVLVPRERCVAGRTHSNRLLKGGLWGKNFVYLERADSVQDCVNLVCDRISAGFAFFLNGTYCYAVKCLEKCEVDYTQRSISADTVTIELARKVVFDNETHCLKTSTHSDVKSSEMSGEYRILRDIVRQSKDIDVRPAISDRDRINMTISLRLVQIIDVDEIGQTLTLNVWTTQEWVNPLLAWNASLYGNVTTINVEPTLVWTPGVVLHNNAGIQPSGIEKQKTKVIISDNGANIWFATTLIKSQCKIYTRYFPFDEQICYLRLSSWTLPYRKFDLSYTGEDKPFDHYINNSEWEVKSFTVRKSLVHYPCCEEPFSEVLYRLHIERKALYYIYTMIVPCTIITALVTMGFYLPPSSGERITLNVTILVAITVYLNIASKKLPTTSENIPLLSTFYFLMVIQVAMSIMATAIVLRMHFRGSLLGKMPKWMKFLLIDCLGRILCSPDFSHVRTTSDNDDDDDDDLANEYHNGINERSNGNVTYLPSNGINNNSRHHGTRRQSRSLEMLPLTTDIGNENHDNLYTNEASTSNGMDYQMRCMSVFQMQRDNKVKITEDITTIIQSEKLKAIKKDQLNEWQFAAMVVDRLLFILSVLAVAGCTVTLIMRPRIPILESADVY